MRRIFVCALLLACLPLTACGSAPVQLKADPLWSSQDGGFDEVSGAAIRGKSIVVAGGANGKERLMVVGGKTGESTWSLTEGQQLPDGDGRYALNDWAHGFTDIDESPIVIDTEDDWLVVVMYGLSGDESPNGFDDVERGVAALSGKDGSVVWSTPLATSEDGGLDTRIDLLAADDKTLLAAASGDKTRVTAIDPTGGEKRWDKTKVLPYRVAGDVVVGERSSTNEVPWDGSTKDENAVVAFDAESGRTLWDLTDEFGHSTVEFTSRETVVVRGAVGSDVSAGDRVQVMDAKSGDEIAEVDADVNTCAVDTATGDDTITCLSDGPRTGLVTVANGKAQETEGPIGGENDGFFVDAVHDGLVYLTAQPHADAPDHFIADTSAELVAKDLPGPAIAVSDDYLVACSCTDDSTGVDIYKVVS